MNEEADDRKERQEKVCLSERDIENEKGDGALRSKYCKKQKRAVGGSGTEDGKRRDDRLLRAKSAEKRDRRLP